MEERNLTERESLNLIATMIKNSKRNVKQNAGGPTLIWGYATVITSILIQLGWYFINEGWVMYGWFLIPVIGGIGMSIWSKKDKPVLVKTFLDSVISYIWIVFGISAGIVSLTAFIYSLPILYFISIMMSAGIVLTGFVCNFKPYIYCGAVGVLLSFLCLVTPINYVILIFAGIFFITMIIPGHIANAQSRTQVAEIAMNNRSK